MRHRGLDRILIWFSRAIFLYLVIFGLLLYARQEWMMWR